MNIHKSLSRVDSGSDVLITVDTLRDINKAGGTYESFVTGTAPDFTPTGTVTVNAGGDLVITGFTTFTAK